MSFISEDFPTPQAPETPMETGFGWTCRIMVATVFAMPLKFRKIYFGFIVRPHEIPSEQQVKSRRFRADYQLFEGKEAASCSESLSRCIQILEFAPHDCQLFSFGAAYRA